MIFSYDDCEKRNVSVTLENGTAITGELIDLRVDPQTLPPGTHWYHIRHTDDDWMEFASVKNGNVLVNFLGTLVCNTEIPQLQEGDESDVLEWDFVF